MPATEFADTPPGQVKWWTLAATLENWIMQARALLSKYPDYRSRKSLSRRRKVEIKEAEFLLRKYS